MAPGLNTTDPLASSVHGANPQALIETITRQKIYNCLYWKSHCFGLDATGVMEKAVDLKYVGSTSGSNHVPTPFICLILKLLQISPDIKIIKGYIKDDAFKYLRVLGCFYLRMVGSPVDIYDCLEACLKDYRKINVRVGGQTGTEQWISTTVDQFVYDLLTKSDGYILGIQLPRLPPRKTLEESVHFKKRNDVQRESDLRGDKRVKERVKYAKRMQRVELGLGGGEEGKDKKKRRKEEGGSLFTKGKSKGDEDEEEGEEGKGLKEGSDEYWNAERAKLGLAPLKK
jgi:pre-mRNA-splicing factor 38A